MNVENKTYQKPALKFISLRNEEAVANTCWGGHSSSMTWYFDYSGTGYVSFQITSSSCNSSNITVQYIDVPEDEQYKAYSELVATLENASGNAGSPWKGEDAVTPITPGQDWS